ncbi:MAG: hypothetical protein GX635_11475 [Synergistaceae bacterium]|nr:hypothetical protein [Synergistaceae bacterium]
MAGGAEVLSGGSALAAIATGVLPGALWKYGDRAEERGHVHDLAIGYR